MLLLGVLASQEAAVPVSAGSYDLLATEILTGTQASVTFSSLGDYATAGYQHLQIRAVVAKDGDYANLRSQMNADTGNNYNWHFLRGNGSSVGSGSNVGDGVTGYILHGNLPVSTTAFSGVVIDYLDAFETNKFKTTRNLMAESSTNIWLNSGLYRSTNALTSIKLYPTSGNFVANSRFSLYGLKVA